MNVSLILFVLLLHPGRAYSHSREDPGSPGDQVGHGHHLFGLRLVAEVVHDAVVDDDGHQVGLDRHLLGRHGVKICVGVGVGVEVSPA